MPESSEVSSGDQAVYTQYNNLRTDALKLWAQGATELTISSGAIAVGTNGFYTVDTESDASEDYLTTISGGEVGEIILLAANNTARTVIIDHAADNIKLQGDQDLPLVDTEQIIMLRYDGSNWIEVGGGADRIIVFGVPLGADGFGALQDGVYNEIPYMVACYLLGIYALCDESGSITISVRNKGSFGVPVSGDEIESVVISSAQTYSDTTLSGVTREQAAGSWRFVVDGDATSIEQTTIVCLAVRL